MSKGKYKKKEINQTRVLLKTYFEANMENPEDRIHEILLDYCKQHEIFMEQLPVLKKLSEANQRIVELEKEKVEAAHDESEKASLEDTQV